MKEWDAEALAKWSSAHISHKQVTNGVLTFEAEAADSMLVSPVFAPIPATAFQQLELTMESSAGGDCEFYWTGTTNGRFGGFTAEKRTPFVAEAGGLRTYHVEPFWQAEKGIIKLRLDFPHDRASRYSIRSLRLVTRPAAVAASLPATNIVLDASGEWRARVSIPLSEFAFVSVRMSASAGNAGVLSFASSDRNGLTALTFPLRADGKPHTYNIDVANASGGKERKGDVIELRLKPSDAGGNAARVEAITAGPDVSGAADLEISYLGLQNPYARSGREERIEALVRNHGGATASNVAPVLTVKGARVLRTNSVPATVDFGDAAPCVWTIQADEPGSFQASVTLDGVTRSATLPLQAARPITKADYVPAPQPAKADCEVGAYYFPGWHTASAWSRLAAFPERRPLLGNYREGDPEVADWQIKWALESGISFFLYDWYWDRGHRHLEHGLSALFQSRYGHLMKFCLLYANHNSPGSHSAADFEAMTRFWLTNYFQRTNYLRIDGKPVVVIFSALNPANDMGVPAVKAAYEHMRARCREAGHGGLYIVACMPPTPGLLTKLSDMGYDAVTAYNWPSINMTEAERHANRAPYATAIDGYKRAWESIAGAGTLPLITPLCGGWDARPWHGEGTLVRTGRSPELFEKHLRDGKEFLNAHARLPRMLLVEAWNEWGEGSYIEPHREFGFGYLDAIRRVFAPQAPAPEHLVPADLGRGPYDIPTRKPATAWDFTHATNTLEWNGNVMNLRIENGALRFKTLGHDPALTSPELKVRASQFSRVRLRVQSSRAIQGQLFWSRRGESLSEAASVRFPITGDNAFHDYTIDVAKNPRWRGVITSLRFDPGDFDGVECAVERVELVP